MRWFFLFSAKVSTLAIHYPLIVSTALFNVFMVMCRQWHLVKLRKRSWSVLWSDIFKLIFKQNHNLSLILTKVLLLCRPDLRQESGPEIGFRHHSPALYAHYPPLPPPCDSSTSHKCSVSFTHRYFL